MKYFPFWFFKKILGLEETSVKVVFKIASSTSPAGSSWCQQRTFRESAVPSAWAVVGDDTSLLLSPSVIPSSALGQQE